MEDVNIIVLTPMAHITVLATKGIDYCQTNIHAKVQYSQSYM